MKLPAAALLAATFAVGACTTVPDTHPLAGTRWQLTAIDTAGSTTTLTPALQSRHTLAFAQGGALEVGLDCNRGRSTWTAGKPASGAGQIDIGPVASTRAFCPEPSFGNQLARISEAERYSTTLDGRQLVIETPGLRFSFAAQDR